MDRQTLSIMKACEVVGVSRRTIYNWIAAGKVELIGGTYSQPLGTMFSGESNIRQIVYGRETIRKALELEVVSQRLADYGLTDKEVSAKLPTLSDEQLHQRQDQVRLPVDWDDVCGHRE